MDQRNAKLFGFFLGIIFAVLASQVVFWLFDFSDLLEYIIMGVLTIIFCSAGIVFTRFITRQPQPQQYPQQTQQQPPVQKQTQQPPQQA